MVPLSTQGGRISQLQKKVHKEYPVWTSFTFLGNIGGSLGLLVGYSVMTNLTWLLGILSKLKTWYDRTCLGGRNKPKTRRERNDQESTTWSK